MRKHPLPPEILKRCRDLRASQTPTEAKLWSCLRDKQLFGAKFRRQYPVGKFIMDFYCYEARLAVELDGGGHAELEQEEYDHKRTGILEAKGIRVLRFWNNDVLNNLEGVIEAIADALPSPLVYPPERKSKKL